MFGVWDEKQLYHQQSWMVIVRFTKAAAGQHRTHSSQWFTLVAQTKLRKRSTTRVWRTHLGLCSLLKTPSITASVLLQLTWFTCSHQSSQSCRNVLKTVTAPHPLPLSVCVHTTRDPRIWNEKPGTLSIINTSNDLCQFSASYSFFILESFRLICSSSGESVRSESEMGFVLTHCPDMLDFSESPQNILVLLPVLQQRLCPTRFQWTDPDDFTDPLALVVPVVRQLLVFILRPTSVFKARY